MSKKVLTPFEVLNDTDGTPLESGYVYIGTKDLNPKTNPISIFWDEALTIPAVQPIRTVGGYFSREGSPGSLYVSVDYSITVENKNQSLVYSQLSNSIDEISYPWIDALDYGDGSMSAATLNAALTALGSSEKYTLLVRRGDWVMDANVTTTSNIKLWIENGVDFQIATGITFTNGGPQPHAPIEKIFTLTGTGVFRSTGDMDVFYPNWWGAIGDNTTDCTDAIRA